MAQKPKKPKKLPGLVPADAVFLAYIKKKEEEPILIGRGKPIFISNVR